MIGKRVFRELIRYKYRTLFAFLGIFLGVLCTGFVLVSYAVLTREMKANYLNTNPSSMTLTVDNLNQRAVELIRKKNPSLDMEVRKKVQARINRKNGTYGTVYLYAVQNIQKPQMDKYTLEKGNFPMENLSLVLERDSLKNLPFLDNQYPCKVGITIPGYEEKQMTLSGTVHAPGLAPASMEKYSYGFVTLANMQSLGDRGWYNQIKIISPQNQMNQEKLKREANELKQFLLSNGYTVSGMEVPVPATHPHGEQLESLLFLIQAFSIISLLVATIIIVNIMSFILTKQRKQIAILKSIGATPLYISRMYLFYVLAISSLAILISFPCAGKLGLLYANIAANILNFKIINDSIPLWVYLLQMGVGILIPILACVNPIYKNVTMSVKDGLAEVTKSGKKKPRRSPKIFGGKVAMSVSNVSRTKFRTTLGIIAIVAGGILFITARNVSSSIEKTVSNSASKFPYQYEVRLNQSYPEKKIQKALSHVDGIQEVETCQSLNCSLSNNSGNETVSYTMKSVPKNSKLMAIDIPKTSQNKRCMNIVVNNAILEDEK